MLEYALLAALLSVAMITGLSAVGDTAADTFEEAGHAIAGNVVHPASPPAPF